MSEAVVPKQAERVLPPRDTFRSSIAGRGAQRFQAPDSESAISEAGEAQPDAEEEEEGSSGTPGGLRVQLRWSSGQNLCLKLRQSLQTSRLEMKCSSFLNPQTGEHNTSELRCIRTGLL